MLLYMHENQLTYPPPPNTKRDLTYSLIQHLSMLATDAVRFNSAYHPCLVRRAAAAAQARFPDYQHLQSIREAEAKSAVLPVGCDLRRFDRWPDNRAPGDAPLVLWNQRWEYDKDETMLRALVCLADEGIPFRVALAGESTGCNPRSSRPRAIGWAIRLVHYGYADDDMQGCSAPRARC